MSEESSNCDHPNSPPCSLCLLQGTSVASLLCLGIGAVIVCWNFPNKDFKVVSMLLGGAYCLAILYFYVGAMYIEDVLSHQFRKTANFPVRIEFFIRCSIITYMVTLIGLAGNAAADSQHPYSSRILLILLKTQIAYLVWDGLVCICGKSNKMIVEHVVRKFFLADLIGLVGSLLMYLASSITLDKNLIPERNSMELVCLATVGAILYIMAVSGVEIVQKRPQFFKGGIWAFALQALRQFIKREIR